MKDLLKELEEKLGQENKELPHEAKIVAKVSFTLWQAMRSQKDVGEAIGLLMSHLTTFTANISDADWAMMMKVVKEPHENCECTKGMPEAEIKLFEALDTVRTFGRQEAEKVMAAMQDPKVLAAAYEMHHAPQFTMPATTAKSGNLPC